MPTEIDDRQLGEFEDEYEEYGEDEDGRSFLFCALCKGNNPDAFLPVSSIHEARAYEAFAVDYWKSKGRM